MEDNKQTIIIENVSCSRGNRVVLDNFSLKVVSGKCLTIKGANGTGKTTLLRMLAGLQKNTNGEIFFGDKNILHIQQEYKNDVFFLNENNPIKNSFTCFENLYFWAKLEGTDKLIPKALESQKLESLKNVPAKFLSMGQKRRLNLSRLAITHKKIWLLDEPLNGLDKESIDRLCSLLRTHLYNNGFLVIASHFDLNLETETIFL
ncbi:MAG: heme ABC exporter ATP-binding protein CcmA [Rhodospirillaceae bacterium]|nr:heme ABC exporter ATP-binding protein CcmA [Rhodospirillaceae bacterium]|tara:strand:- start:389 stop:1000 length:612 start_codon:yes stop_codon:yes gene_type:complete